MYWRYRKNIIWFKLAVTAIGFLIVIEFIILYFKLVIALALLTFVYNLCKKFGINRAISKERYRNKSGKIGEYRVNKELNRVSLDKILLNDINLNYERQESQIDHILITKQGVFNVETKNYSGIISIDSNGTWRQTTHRGEYVISDFDGQVLQHRNTLNRILHGNCSIYDLIVIANEDTKIVGADNSKVHIVKIDELKSYIENIELDTSINTLEEISNMIRQYQIPYVKKVAKKLKYYVLNNRAFVGVVSAVIVVYISVIHPLPNSLTSGHDKRTKEETVNTITMPINQNINFEKLNTNINFIKMSTNKKYITMYIDITNNNKDSSIELGWFKFFVYDASNKCYEITSYIDDIPIFANSLNYPETKQILLKLDNINDIKVKKLAIKYNDYIQNEFDKEIKLN